ncbi:family 43 glycosylhydrolase [Catenuloplanes atrovinosus]|uniref:GH43 family beta-xylosidase n=1 Tax=Catenuloplanes atrovinosus TaxID=137266 RepID=A0AAE4C900_9ACTN|nr:family 43 glycosylhydrolase [Catenuloplanes atrovinosus]MDR7275187.1 GH43 family beta-xylosidase [Catenuloplanes atrovinosus]
MTSRRNLLLGVAGAGMLGGLGAATPATARDDRTDAEIYGVPTADPLIAQRADPFITPRTGGRYYFTASVPEYDRLIVRGASTIAGLATAAESVVWRRPASGPMGGHIWAPELHRIDGRWYIYFAAGDSDDVFRIRTYVLESPLADPADPAGWTLRGRLATEWDGFTLDATTFAHRGRRYLVWAQSEPEIAVNSSLYIAPMSNPWTLGGKPTRIATPTRDWEIQGFKVNEGPAVLIRNGRVFVTFSASATDARYAMGLLTAPASADLLRHASWTKTPGPVLTTNEHTRRYGPGHNSFTVAEDGVTDVLVYHARDYRDITGDPLYDPNRHTRVQKLYWHPDGTPMFGIPVGTGGPIVRISPAGVRDAFVRHDPADGTVTVPVAPRDLENTQFRFVPGLAGAGTESIESVSRPGRYLRVVNGTVRVEPAAAGDGPASFRRTRRPGGGITVQLAADPAVHLRHERGALVAGTRPGAFTLS